MLFQKSQQEQHGAKEWETIFHPFFTHFSPIFFHGRQGSISATWTILAGVFFLGGAGCGATQIIDFCWLVTPRTERTVRFLKWMYLQWNRCLINRKTWESHNLQPILIILGERWTSTSTKELTSIQKRLVFQWTPTQLLGGLMVDNYEAMTIIPPQAVGCGDPAGDCFHLLPIFGGCVSWKCCMDPSMPSHGSSMIIPNPLQGMKVSKTWATCRHAAMGWWRPFIKVSVTSTPSKFRIGELPGLVNIQKTIENGHRNSGFTH